MRWNLVELLQINKIIHQQAAWANEKYLIKENSL